MCLLGRVDMFAIRSYYLDHSSYESIMSQCSAPASLVQHPALGTPVLVVSITPELSATLPSRGMVMATGTINGKSFLLPFEPDGKGSHWLYVAADFAREAGIVAGEQVNLSFEVTKEWPEPQVPDAFMKLVSADSDALATWQDTTPMARWEWVRWIGAAKQVETRTKRMHVGLSKLHGGMRRPCCFDRAQCTVTGIWD